VLARLSEVREPATAGARDPRLASAV